MSNRIEILGKGWVELHSHYLTDEDIAKFARVSTGNGLKGAEKDKLFIDYLYRHEHHSPFGFPQVTFKLYIPIFVDRQISRHRTHEKNEFSGRYSEMPEDMYLPDVDRIQLQDTDNRQGSGDPLDPDQASRTVDIFRMEQMAARDLYEVRLSDGVSKEIARINLPLSQFTVFYWQMSLRNLLHLIRLRIDEHAQWEARQVGQAMYDLIQPIYPWTCEAFEKHVVHGRKFHRDEMEILREVMASEVVHDLILARTDGWRKSHRREFLEKLGIE